MPSTTGRWGRDGRPIGFFTGGSNGSIRAHASSPNTAARVTRRPSQPRRSQHSRHALVAEIATNAAGFHRIASTIGGYVVFPRNRAGQTGWTINQSRGMQSSIADRFDLTLECIRRHYCDPRAANPLGERLDYYDDFFALFRDFDTYVRFFLLDDLVDDTRNVVRSLVTGDPLVKFSVPASTTSAADYRRYRQRSITFITARNERIQQLGV